MQVELWEKQSGEWMGWRKAVLGRSGGKAMPASARPEVSAAQGLLPTSTLHSAWDNLEGVDPELALSDYG